MVILKKLLAYSCALIALNLFSMKTEEPKISVTFLDEEGNPGWVEPFPASFLLKSTVLSDQRDQGLWVDVEQEGINAIPGITASALKALLTLYEKFIDDRAKAELNVEDFNATTYFTNKFLEYPLNDVFTIIQAINILDFRFLNEKDEEDNKLLLIACNAFAQKIKNMDDIGSCLKDYTFNADISRIVAHYILKNHDILEDLCHRSFGKGKKRILYTQPISYMHPVMNARGDVVFIHQAGNNELAQLYFFSIDTQQITQIPLNVVLSSYRRLSAACTISKDGNEVVCLITGDQKTLFYFIDIKNNTMKIIDHAAAWPVPLSIIFSPDEQLLWVGSFKSIKRYTTTGELFGKGDNVSFSNPNKFIHALRYRGNSDSNYLFVAYSTVTEKKEAVYDTASMSWIDENDIPEDILHRYPEEFNYDTILQSIEYGSKKDPFIIEKTIEEALLDKLGIQNKFTIFGKSTSTYRILGASEERGLFLIDLIPDNVRDLIFDFNGPPFNRKIMMQDALYLFAAKFKKWDASAFAEIDRLFEGHIVSQNILDLARITLMKDAKFEEVPIVEKIPTILRAAPSSGSSSSSSSEGEGGGQGGNQPPQALIQPPMHPAPQTFWQRWAPQWLQQKAAAAQTQMTAVQKKFSQLYNVHERTIKYGLGTATAAGLGWLYYKYYGQRGPSIHPQ